MAAENWLDLIKDAGASSTFQPLPDGDYDLKVVEVTATETSNHKPMYKLKAEVQTGPHAGRFVWDNLVVSKESPKALGFFFRKMSALGLGQEFFQSQPTDATIVQNLQGKPFRGKIGSRLDNTNTQRNEIREYHAAVGGYAAPSAPAVPPPAAAPVQAAPVAAPPAPAPAVAPPPPAAPPAAASPWDASGAPAVAAPPPPPPF